MNRIAAVWLKDLQAVLFTWKSLVWLLVASVVFSVTSYLMLTNKELSLLDQTEMLWLLGKIVVGMALLVIVIDASSAISAEYELETIEDLLLSPLTLLELTVGKLAASLSLWTLLYAVAVPYMAVTSSGSGLTWAFLGYTALLGTLVVAGFILFVFAVSFLLKSVRNTLTGSLTVLMALTVPALFSSALKKNELARFLGVIDPVDNVFSALDNILVDHQVALGQNQQFIVPLVVFCIVMSAFLVLSARASGGRGGLKD